MVASLIRLTGDWDLAEDCVQAAVERALVRWPRDGIPRSPAAWLTTVARNRALDVLRRRRTERAKLQERALSDAAAGDGSATDDRLALIFTCCHPALPLEGRVALTLRTVAGLSTAEIARAFLVSEPAMSQRLLRTKRKIAHAAVPYRVPPADRLAERTGGVLAVVYLVYNAGYGQPDGRLAGEARRLARVLVDLMPGDDEARGLLALLALQESRAPPASTRRATRCRWRSRSGAAGTVRRSPRGGASCGARRRRGDRPAVPAAGGDRGPPRRRAVGRGDGLARDRPAVRRTDGGPAVAGGRPQPRGRRGVP